jgi:hypothetical protein
MPPSLGSEEGSSMFFRNICIYVPNSQDVTPPKNNIDKVTRKNLKSHTFKFLFSFRIVIVNSHYRTMYLCCRFQ